MPDPITILLVSRNRPLYLWASLDSLYRLTRYPHRFVLLDMASDDPLVPRVIEGFERRHMFSQVIRSSENDPRIIWRTIWSLVSDTEPFFAFAETDVIVEDTEPCWLGSFVAAMERHEKLAMVGAAIDKRDFISLDEAKSAAPDQPDWALKNLIKFTSPERTQVVPDGDGDLMTPHCPPGRLMLLRNKPLRQVGAGTDLQLHHKFRAAGYDTAIAKRVRHRHLSFLNLYDYGDYDMAARDAFMQAMDEVRD